MTRTKTRTVIVTMTAVLAAAATLTAHCIASTNGSSQADSAPIFTRTGEPASANAALAFSLSRMHSYLSLGVPSELVREHISSPELAAAIGREGRALVGHVLDRAHEITIYKQPKKPTRKRFFRTLESLNQRLADHRFGYFVYASFVWDESFKGVDEVRFDALAIRGVRRFQAGDDVIRVLSVHRLGPARSHKGSLGFTAADYNEAFILPERIFDELHIELLSARHASAETRLFAVSAEQARSDWYTRFRSRLATILREDLGEQPDRASFFAQESMMHAVSLHELQHQLDYRRKLFPRRAFRALADKLNNKRLATTSMHEASAHLAQLARDPSIPRVLLAEIASYAFQDSCDDANCLAAIIILNEIAAELGFATIDGFLKMDSYALQTVTERYLAIAMHTPDAISAAAQRTWERLFAEPLVPVIRLP